MLAGRTLCIDPHQAGGVDIIADEQDLIAENVTVQNQLQYARISDKELEEVLDEQ